MTRVDLYERAVSQHRAQVARLRELNRAMGSGRDLTADETAEYAAIEAAIRDREHAWGHEVVVETCECSAWARFAADNDARTPVGTRIVNMTSGICNGCGRKVGA